MMSKDQDLEQRLVELGQTLAEQRSVVPAVVRRIETLPVPGPAKLRRWIMRGVLTLSTAASLTLILWLAAGPEPPVYGIEDVADQVAQVKSLYVSGYSYEPVPGVPDRKIRIPTAFYVQRPDRYWQLGHSAVRTQDELKVRTHVRASDGRRYMSRNETEKTFTVGQELPIVATLRVEFVLQNQFFQQLLGGRPDLFSKTGSIRIDGSDIDIYQRVVRFREVDRQHTVRFEVWLDRTTGIPTRSLMYQRIPPGTEEELVTEFDEIVVDGPPPEGAFEFDPPDGYQVIERDREMDRLGFSASDSRSGAQLRVLQSFAVGDGPIVLLWAAYHDSDGEIREVGTDLETGEPLQIEGLTATAGQVRYRVYHLQAHAAPAGFHWRWSLLVPSEEDRQVEHEIPLLRWHTPQWDLSSTLSPLRFNRPQLATVLDDVQRQLVPDPAAPRRHFDLKEVEMELHRLTSQ